jgi:predicted nucleotidyltransferase
MEFDIAKHTILLVLSGSHAYGMARTESDVDLRGVAIPPAEYFHGYLRQFEQCEEPLPRNFDVGGITLLNKIQTLVGRIVPETESIDSVVYSLPKYISLCAQCNPNLLEMLWTDESAQLLRTPLADLLLENRDLFLSTKVRWSYSGYAMSQLKRLRAHRQHLLHPPTGKPTRTDFGLPEHTVMPMDQLMAAESLISRKVEEWLGSKEDLPKDVLLEVRQRTTLAIRDIWSALATDHEVAPPLTEDGDLDEGRIRRAAGKLLGYDSNFLELLDRERGYRSKIAQWRQYEDWKKNRNPARAEMEARFGYDGKHASHLVRLMRQAKEILETGKVIVKRPDATDLLAIRNGAWTYEQLIEWAEKQDKELDEFYTSGKSPLPKKPDHVKLDLLCQKIVEESMR